MRRLSSLLLRIALAVPLVWEAYRCMTFCVIDVDRRLGIPWLTLAAFLVLPGLGMLLGCVLLLVLRRARWGWLAIAASGLLIVLVWYLAFPQTTWRPQPDAAIGAYAALLAFAFLLAPRRRVAV